MRRACSLAAALLASCSSEKEAPRPSNAEVIDDAKTAAGAAFERLSGELAKAIAEGGPVHAIPVCSSKAESLTSGAAAAHGLEMVRLSDRPRNPEQRATGEDLAALEAMRETPKPRVAWRDDGTALVRLPIMINNPLCLKCHGGEEEVADETRRVLAELYPDDEATGYTMDDLRGIWRIEVPPSR